MSRKNILPLIFTLFIVFFVPKINYSQTMVCHISDTEQFMKQVNDEGNKTIEFLISGLSDSQIDTFIKNSTAVENVLSVKVGDERNGSRKVSVRLNETGGMNTFRLMLMSAAVKTIITPIKTFDVLHLPVKKANPFE
jgi:hypothetical protein